MGPPVNPPKAVAWKGWNLGSAGRNRCARALPLSLGAVAGPEPMIQQSPDSEAPGAVGWGVLRLVRQWPSDGTAPDGSPDGSPDVWPDQLPPERDEAPHLTLLPPPDAAFDRRAAALALHQVLAEWRLGARDLDRFAEGSLEWSRMRAQVAALRDAYHRLFREIRGSVAT